MDSEALLDYALFQLTPTRTRCVLLVFSGGNKEQLASGLVEPFISHLKFAKDQIPKGGYSITLRPPNPDASWFTKATFQRVVRFITSPEILERFVRLEREILQIESSIQCSELSFTNFEAHAGEGSLPFADGNTKKSTDSSKPKTKEAGDIAQEENSKIQLQRLLETRKALLRKEQAMAYARALVAGFEMDNMHDLILFADNFGASRLRDACIEFMELCKKKHTDGLWMEELAAMAAHPPSELAYLGTSGVLLTSESNASSLNNPLNFHNSMASIDTNGSLDASSDSNATQSNLEGNKDQLPSTPVNVQVQIPWMNQIPQYMYNFPGPVQQIPPGQVYPYPGMPPYYPGHMHWPSNLDESIHGGPDHRGNHKSVSSKKKEKSPSTRAESESSEEEEQFESSESDSEIVTKHEKSSSTKKHKKKKSSKTVVIRNINYITSKRKDGDSDDDDYSSVDSELVDEDSLKHKVDGVIQSLVKHKKSSKSHSSSKKKGSNEFDLAANISEETPKQNENWDAFQNLLMKDDETSKIQSMDVQDEHFTIKSLEYESGLVQSKNTNDAFVIPERDGVNENKVNSADFANGENFQPSMKGRDSSDAEMFISKRSEERESHVQKTLSDFQPESSRIRNGKEEDWFVVNHSEKSIEKTTFDDYYVSSGETNKGVVPFDDSFMVQPRTTLDDDEYDSKWRTEISMDEQHLIVASSHSETEQCDGAHEPDDLCVVVSRDSGIQSGRVSWTPEIDYGIGIQIPFKKAEQKSAPVETNDQTEEKVSVNGKSKKAASPGANKSKVSPGYLRNTKCSELLSKNKKTQSASRPFLQKSKLQQEEEMRKKMEELAIERQKRIAERTAAASKTAPTRSKTGTMNSAKVQAVTGQIKNKGGSNQLRKTSSKAMGV